MSRKLPVHGGPLDGSERRSSRAFWIADDGSVYRFSIDRWEFCGPRSGRCSCGTICLVPAGHEPTCDLCGSRLILPGES